MCANTTDSKPIADSQSADVFDCVLEQALCLYMLGSYAPCSFSMYLDSTIMFTFAYCCVCVCVYIYTHTHTYILSGCCVSNDCMYKSRKWAFV